MHERKQRGRCDGTEEISEDIATEKFPEIIKKDIKM